MLPQTDKIIAESSIPAPLLELLRRPAETDGDIWKQRFQALVEQLPVMLYTTAPDDLANIEYTSAQFARWLGYENDEWTDPSQLFASRLHPDDLPRVEANDRRAIETGESFEIEYRLQARDGSWHWVRDCAMLLRDASGAAIAWQGVSIDITDLKEAESEEAAARRLYRSLVDKVPGVVFRESTEKPPRALYVSPQVEDLIGYSPDEWHAVPCIWELIVHPDDQPRVYREHVAGSANAAIRLEYRMTRKDGETIWVREDREMVLDDDGRPYSWQGLLVDITRQKQLEAQLEHQARHDALTGLPNRTYFGEIVTRALASNTGDARRIALIFLDLDGFKATNDSYGHEVGDNLLAAAGQRLQSALREGDVIARLGGDEFAILLAHPVDRRRAVEMAGRVLETLRRPFTVNGHEIRCSGSAGIAFGTAGRASLADLLRQADVAMYRAKSRGKDRYAIYGPGQFENSGC